MKADFPIYDAHNHLQDERLASHLPSIILELESIPVRKAVINGTRPEDWAAVDELARKYQWVIPSFGLHPWYVNHVCENWRVALGNHVRAQPAAIGEIGLDRWIKDYDSPKQEEAFIWQLRLAAELKRPVTIHCLKAWGRLLEILQSEKLPSGFLLHSYGGSAEMISRFIDLGGYFSISGYFSHERKKAQREVFKAIPLDRILLETDAPDMALPAEWKRHSFRNPSSAELNHPADISAIYAFASQLYGIDVEELASRIEANFIRLFGLFCP
ncbi:MAG: TatD family hydrolase [Limisphaerales bacterium]